MLRLGSFSLLTVKKVALIYLYLRYVHGTSLIIYVTRLNKLSESKPTKMYNSKCVTVAYVRNVDWKRIKPLRAGVIVYVNYNGGIIFCMGVDKRTKEITDFGGGVSYKNDGNTIVGGLREFTEESLGVFGKFSPEDIRNCVVVHSKNMAIFFIPLQCDPVEINRLFLQRYGKEKNEEVSSLAWMNRQTFVTCLITGKFFYVRVLRLLRPVYPIFLAMI